jgi:hypothetical protein
MALGSSTRVVIVDAAKDAAQKDSVTTARIAFFMGLPGDEVLG